MSKSDEFLQQIKETSTKDLELILKDQQDLYSEEEFLVMKIELASRKGQQNSYSEEEILSAKMKLDSGNNPPNNNTDVVRCPFCQSTSIHFITIQGGQRLDVGAAACGLFCCGPLGLLFGVQDHETQTIRKCMNCNQEF